MLTSTCRNIWMYCTVVHTFVCQKADACGFGSKINTVISGIASSLIRLNHKKGLMILFPLFMTFVYRPGTLERRPRRSLVEIHTVSSMDQSLMGAIPCPCVERHTCYVSQVTTRFDSMCNPVGDKWFQIKVDYGMFVLQDDIFDTWNWKMCVDPYECVSQALHYR